MKSSFAIQKDLLGETPRYGHLSAAKGEIDHPISKSKREIQDPHHRSQAPKLRSQAPPSLQLVLRAPRAPAERPPRWHPGGPGLGHDKAASDWSIQFVNRTSG